MDPASHRRPHGYPRAPDDRQPLETNLHMCDGLFVKHATFARGTYIPQHSHDLPHLTVVATGSVSVWADDQWLGDFSAPAGIVIEARIKHLFRALEDRTTVLCIHRVDGDGLPATHETNHLAGET